MFACLQPDIASFTDSSVDPLTKLRPVVKACNAGRFDVWTVTAAGFMLSADGKAPVQQAIPLYK